MRVIGTAGHVDHGKSTLVQALSGIDPDRLKEEKARGMTIDLGFAWIELAMPDGRAESVGIVDVPGHIDFIKNMLAGVGGIDAAMLVIAADEGVMPQTREHLAILDLLAVPAGLVVLTKVDLIDDPDWLDLVEMDVHDLLVGTVLAGAPVVRVSAVTGEGLPDLRHDLARLLAHLPPRRNRARPRLPVDRIFSLTGLGTVVTGTLSDGQFRVGDLVEVLPEGRSARIRGLQTHRQQVWTGEPGSRLAINLAGVSVEEVRRGDVIARPGTLPATILVDVRFRLLADAPKALAHNQRVDLFVGAAEIPAYVRVLGAEQIEPGQEGWLQLRLDRPAVLVAGDHFILRQPSPSATLGGGQVLSAQPRRRWRRFDPDVLKRLQTLSRGTPDEIVLHTLVRNPFVVEHELLRLSDLDPDEAQRALAELRSAGALKPLTLDNGDTLWLTLELWEALLSALARMLDGFHQQAPLRRGMPRGEVRSRLQATLPQSPLSVRLFNAIVMEAQSEGRIVADDSFIWHTEFVVKPTLHQQAMVDALLAEFERAPFMPPNQQESLRKLGDDAELLAMLLEQGLLVRMGGDVLFRREDFVRILERIEDHLREQGTITLAETRDLFQTTRKYAQAVLEEMDARRITRRDGDLRVLR